MKKSKKKQIKELRLSMYDGIKAMNGVITDEYLNGLSIEAVIGMTHPLYRENWQEKYDKINRK